MKSRVNIPLISDNESQKQSRFENVALDSCRGGSLLLDNLEESFGGKSRDVLGPSACADLPLWWDQRYLLEKCPRLVQKGMVVGDR